MPNARGLSALQNTHTLRELADSQPLLAHDRDPTQNRKGRKCWRAVLPARHTPVSPSQSWSAERQIFSLRANGWVTSACRNPCR